MQKPNLSSINQSIEKWLSFGIEGGLDWYDQAHSFSKELSIKHDVKIQVVAGLIAATSPMKSWPLNKKMVEDFLQGTPIGHLGNQVQKCKLIMELKDLQMSDLELDNKIIHILRGKKTSSFYHNIMYPKKSNRVTIDVHIWNALNPGWNHLTEKRYDLLEQSIKQKAKELKLPVAALQASIWVNYKKYRFA